MIILFLLFTTLTICGQGQIDIFQELEKESPPILFAPGRDSYSPLNQIPSNNKECPFCREMNADNDEKYFILRRFKYSFIALNIFPYTKAHLLIIPLEHRSHLKDLSPQARMEIIELANISLQILEKQYEDVVGANIGFNIGKIAGASVPGHLHLHVVPRTFIPSFIYVIGKTCVAACDLKKVYKELKPEFDAIVI